MDSEKKLVEVIINGKAYKLTAEDGEDYIKTVAGYVDRKYREITAGLSTVTRLSDSFPIMLALNIADDLFKQSEKSGSSLKANADLQDKIAKLQKALDDEKKLSEEKNEIIEKLRQGSDNIVSDKNQLEKDILAEKEKLEAANTVLEAQKSEIKRLQDIIADAGLVPPVPDKNGKIKDKDKDRETLLKELNDIKSENGRTKKENKSLAEKLKAAEDEIEVLRSQSPTKTEADGQLVLKTDAPVKETETAAKKQ
ncbi:MAG: cell division protein ZapA [Clostridiales bacterium]|nr:cell division protein ZapA [Clostridiales bacterium]